VIAQARTHFDHLDILVNCAGIIRRADFLEFSEKDWDDVMGINIDAVFFHEPVFRAWTSWPAAARENHQHRLDAVFQGGTRVPSYTCSKSAVQGLTRLMANELAAKASTPMRLRRVTWRRTTPRRCGRTPTRERDSRANSGGAVGHAR